MRERQVEGSISQMVEILSVKEEIKLFALEAFMKQTKRNTTLTIHQRAEHKLKTNVLI